MFKRITGKRSNALSVLAVAAMIILAAGTTQFVSASDNTPSFYQVFNTLGKVFSPTAENESSAGDSTPVDLLAPSITFTPLPNSALTTNRTVTVTITDPTGVAGGILSPRIYFRKNGVIYISTQCVMTGGTPQNGTYECTIDYSLVGGVMPGDVIDYFIVAQDTLGSVSSAPGGVVATSVNLITVPPAPASFIIVTPFPSTVTVGTGGNFTSLTNTGGLFAALNAGILTGNVTAEIISDLTGETGSVPLNQLVEQGAGAGTYRVTIKPSGAPRLIQGTTTASLLIRLLGADRVTIDGSLAGGTDRSLIIESRSSANGAGAIFIGSLGPGAGAVSNTIKNTIIRGGSVGSPTIFTFGIFVGSATGLANGADNDNLTIQNTLIHRASTGIQALGDVAGLNDNLQIINNIIGNDSFEFSIGRQGMNIGLARNAVISGNTVRNIALDDPDTVSPVGILVQAMTTATISQNTITNILNTGNVETFGFVAHTSSTGLNITRNNINNISGSGTSGANVFGAVIGTGVVNSSFTRNNITNIRYTGTGGFGGKGLDINTGVAASNLTIANNFISDIRGTAVSTASDLRNTIIGLRIAGSTGGVKLYYNSVNLGHGDFAGSNQPTVTAAFFVGTGVTGLDVRNNVFANNLNNTTVTTDKNYAFYSQAAGTAFTTIDYNDYFVPASSATGPQVLGFLGTDLLTLAGIQAATGQDANSKSVNPLFVSATNLHIQAGSPLRGMAVPIQEITNDFDGDTRNPVIPDIGADEFLSFAPPTVQFSSANYSGAEGTSVTITVTRSGNTSNASSVIYTTLGGTATGGTSCGPGVDYIFTFGIFNFAAGETSKTFTVQLCSDLIIKGEETINIELVNPEGATLGTPSTATLTITDVIPMFGQLQLSSSSYSVDEAAGGVVITVTRTNGDEGAVSVNYSTSDGTATGGAVCAEGVDFITTSGILNFAHGETTQTFIVPICNDGVIEPDETFNVTLSDPSGGAVLGTPTGATVTIQDDDIPLSVQFASAEFTGREGTQAIITVTRMGRTFGTVLVNFATADGTATGGASCSIPGVDYVTTSGTLRFEPGVTSQSFTVQLCRDLVAEPSETVNLVLSDPTGSAILGSPSQAVLTILDSSRIRNDFDGDGKTDLAVFHPTNNAWVIRESLNGATRLEVFGNETDKFVPADFDGDGQTDVAVFRPSSGAWYILQSGTNSLRAEFWGIRGDFPVAADFDGDGKVDLAVWRESTGTWYIKHSLSDDVSIQPFGQIGDQPLIGDFDGDGKSDISVMRADESLTSPVTIYILNSADSSIKTVNWGNRSDAFVIEDYDGDRKDDLAVFRQGVWYILKSSDNSLLVANWGSATDVPLAGDFDGDGQIDLTVWRESTGTYYTKGSAGKDIYQPWGASGDIPLTSKVGF